MFGLSGLSGFWLNETNQMNEINQINQTNQVLVPPQLVVQDSISLEVVTGVLEGHIARPSSLADDFRRMIGIRPHILTR